MIWPALFDEWRRGQVVRQRPAKPSPPVRIRASPPIEVFDDDAKKRGLHKGRKSATIVDAVHGTRAFSSGGERFPDTEEATSSNLVTPTIIKQVNRIIG